MAYDSEIYGQSPFGNSSKPKGDSKPGQKESPKSSASDEIKSHTDDGLDKGPEEGFISPSLAESFPTVPATTPTAPPTTQPVEKTVNRWMGKLGLKSKDKTSTLDSGAAAIAPPNQKSPSKSRTTSKSTKTAGKSTRKSARKSKKTKAAEAAQAEADAAEAAIACRFREEDRRTYLSLLYKTGISALVWAVLRLSRHEFSDDTDRIINIIIHPLLIAFLALISVVALTVWLRHLMNDLAKHTQQLNADAEVTDGKNYRPTLEIVGDSLEYNPKLRKNLASLFNVASILGCSLISYLIVFTAFP